MLKYYFSKQDARTKIFNTKVKTLLGFVLIKAFEKNCRPKNKKIISSTYQTFFFFMVHKISKISQSMWYDQYVVTSSFAVYTTTIKKKQYCLLLRSYQQQKNSSPTSAMIQIK